MQVLILTWKLLFFVITSIALVVSCQESCFQSIPYSSATFNQLLYLSLPSLPSLFIKPKSVSIEELFDANLWSKGPVHCLFQPCSLVFTCNKALFTCIHMKSLSITCVHFDSLAITRVLCHSLLFTLNWAVLQTLYDYCPSHFCAPFCVLNTLDLVNCAFPASHTSSCSHLNYLSAVTATNQPMWSQPPDWISRCCWFCRTAYDKSELLTTKVNWRCKHKVRKNECSIFCFDVTFFLFS